MEDEKQADCTLDSAGTQPLEPQLIVPDDEGISSLSAPTELLNSLPAASVAAPVSSDEKEGSPAVSPKFWSGALSSIGLKLLGLLFWASIVYAILTFLCSSIGLLLPASHAAKIPFMDQSFRCGLFLYWLWSLYTFAIVCRFAARKRDILFKSALPLLLSNVLFAWGTALGCSAYLLSGLVHFVKMSDFLKVPVIVLSTGWLILVLVGLLIVSIIVFSRFYAWIAERSRVVLAANTNVSGARSTGALVGLIIGIDGLWICLNSPVGGSSATWNAVWPWIVPGTLMWSLAAIVSLTYLSQFRKHAKDFQEPRKRRKGVRSKSIS